MSGKHLLIGALLALSGLIASAETASAQVRVVVGVGGRGGYPYSGYYGRGYYPYTSVYFGPSFYASRYYPAPLYYSAPPTYYYASPPSVTYVPPAPQPPTYVVPAAATSSPAYIRVLVPDANAQVWFDGNLTKQTGLDRLFHTPSLAPGGAYSYRIRASWMEKGEQMIQERVVSVTPGQTATADFRGPVSEPVPTPK